MSFLKYLILLKYSLYIDKDIRINLSNIIVSYDTINSSNKKGDNI